MNRGSCMEPIASFEEVVQKLKEYEIVATKQDGVTTFCSYRNGQIRCKQMNGSYILSLQMFEELFRKQVFYLYEKQNDEGINLEKDVEYYTWREKYQ